MTCPDCQHRLELVFAMETRDKARPLEIDLQWFRCNACGERFFAILIEDKTNIFDDDFTHTGYRPDPAEWEATQKIAAQCPSPRDKGCTCSIHQNPPRCNGPTVWNHF
jgi:hypothetical protein